MSKWKLPDFITRQVLIALVIGGIAGIGFMLFLIEFDDLTSSEAFCTTCHSMEIAAQAYRQSTHYNPVSGVRASCGDCHVSEGVIAATWDHILGGKDLLTQISGKLFGPDYDDPVVNAMHLPQAAFEARKWFKAKDSATCRRCHVLEAIQGKRADTNAIHLEETDGKSCIDCHINLVHRKVPDEKTFKMDRWQQMVEEEFGLEPGSAQDYLSK
ncbi:MAG: NapC/NirT family cytochrome c [Candidatus Thiodiazotropha sp.]|nr:NapC/NirT family cytochrome c [Candidatus Thiodiazotropha taylori]MBT3059497.1 NapC/NirT family cytochrome c [Candidatus Thiodiazotropha sp. (ex Lucina pensylvanica)]MBT3061423.1 NapC/NirT family cytochrome c [Candidatus Thiodiazotropha sp. (ex Lucina pensylvanica)]MBV2096574.1 NapC/NirT family cytochrome c [Candidatus Thiodiazotropha sp. (ex Codakia orbicularis)]PUB74799.1 MAG: cytochrome C [gamma proteobacterium symbiont of Ctena orbiculata]